MVIGAATRSFAPSVRVQVPVDCPGGVDHPRPHARRAEQRRADEAVMVATVAGLDLAGRLAECPPALAEPDAAEVEIRLAHIAQDVIAQLAAGDVAGGIDHRSLPPARASQRRDAGLA